jgi:glyoxylase-like metal-dependent hydrolase (beta-lactamase superfamily II)
MIKSLFFFLFFSLGLGARAQSQVVYSNDHVDVIRLDEHVLLFRENFRFTANCIVIEGENQLMILDTGFEEVSPDLVDALMFLGKEVTYIVNSHSHHDHIGANKLFGDEVNILGHKNCEGSYTRPGQAFIGVESNHTFDFDGHLVFCMSYTGGHSDCDMMILIPDLNLAYLGDLYLSESFPLVNTGSANGVEILMGHLNEIYQSLPDETRLFPGHGKETTMEYFGGYIALVEETIEVVLKKMKSGKSLQDIQEADVLKPWAKWGAFFPFITKESWIEQIYLSYSK